MLRRLKLKPMIAMLAICLSASVLFAQRGEESPEPVKDESILWSADYEEGNLDDWEFYDYEFAGGGVFNSGGLDVQVVAEFGLAHTGVYSAKATISNAYRALSGKRAVRMTRWTDRPWDDAGFYFPNEAYYSTWMYFPKTYNPNKYAPWDPGDGGWWNLMQFKANDELGVAQEIWSLGVDHDDKTGEMSFNLFSFQNNPSSHRQVNPVAIPVGEWVHVEAYYRPSSGKSGQITIWQDGVKILDASGIQTALTAAEEYAIWSLENHTDHIVGDDEDGSATVFFDDSVISTKRVSAKPIPAGK